MASKICGQEVNVPRNGLKMQDVPLEIYKNLIQIILKTILNHHRDDISGECMRVVIHWVEDIPVDIPYLLAKKLHSALQESQLRKVKFSFPGTLQKIIDLCRAHATETEIGDINQHGKISLPKPPVHKTYVRKRKSKEHNEEFPIQYPQHNEELVQYPKHHGELPLHPVEQNEESPVQSPEHHGELRVQYPDVVTNDH